MIRRFLNSLVQLGLLILAIIVLANLIGRIAPASWTQWLRGWTVNGGGHVQIFRPGFYNQTQYGDEAPATMPVIYPPAVPTASATPSPTPTGSSTPVGGGTLPQAWNCSDYTYVISDGRWYGQANAETMTVCADPNTASFGVMVHNGVLTDATISWGDYTEGSVMHVAFNGAPGCVNTTLGCLYHVTAPILPAYGQMTFGSMASGLGIPLYPNRPELGTQGVRVFLRVQYLPGYHGIELYP